MDHEVTSTQRRKIRTRARVARFSDRPRLSVFRSGKHIYAQVIEPNTGNTIASASDLDVKTKGTKTEAAFAVGKQIAEKALAKGVTEAVFDRGSYKYHGRVKAVCEGARQAKLII